MRLCTLYTYYTDSTGNAWLAVPMQDVETLRLAPFISAFSHAYNGLVYLDKYCDAPLFLDARRMHAPDCRFVDVFDGELSPIADYPAFDVCAQTA